MNFQEDITTIIQQNKTKNILNFFKILYEGLKLRSLPLNTEELLYMGCLLPDESMQTIKENLNKKLKHLPSSIVFYKRFLVFNKDKTVAENFLGEENKPLNYSKVLFILEKDDNLTYSLSSHCDVEKISYFSDHFVSLFDI